MPLPNYVAPGGTYVTPEYLAGQNLNAAISGDGGPNLTGQLVNNLSGALKGELPDDVKQLLQQKAAQNAVSSGTSGSQFADYQGLRTLGLTSLDRMQHAEDSLVNPLLGYHPPFIQPQRQYSPPIVANQGGGGFENTTPHYNVGPIRGPGGAPAPTGNPTLPNYQQGGAQPNYGNDAMAIQAKYGPGGGAGGWNAGGDWNNPGAGSANAGFGAGGGSTYFGDQAGYDANQNYNQMQGLEQLGYDPQALDYPSMDNLGYADQPSQQVLDEQAIYE